MVLFNVQNKLCCKETILMLSFLFDFSSILFLQIRLALLAYKC